ncbi:MAG: hypothetical protein VX527_09655 [Planctomycetota bacterium]|nr:hypothetical protein [Planctomycetota bacterium]
MTTNVVLKRHDVDPVRGFLPHVDPLEQLPESFAAWEQVAAAFGNDPIGTRVAIESMPVLDSEPLFADQGACHRAMLLLSVLGSGYVHAGESPAKSIPACVSIPWQQIAQHLGRPMIISHASIVIDNWAIEPGGDLIRPETLRTHARFAGGQDEDWFYLVTVSIEAAGAAVMPTIVEARLAMEQDTMGTVARCLDHVTETVDTIRTLLNRMEERCRPRVFYDSVRPYLSGWPKEGVIYEGVDDTPQCLFGGSAAQSSLLQAIDAAMGVTHEDNRSRHFLQAMRDYMPPPHRAFIEWLESGPSLQVGAQQANATEAYDRAIDALDQFRRDHMAITARYITQQGDETAEGTGGTEYGTFLRVTRKETTDQRLD